MKKALAFLMAACMLLSICACGNRVEPLPSHSVTIPVTTNPVTQATTEATEEATGEVTTQTTTVPVTEPVTEAPTTEATEAPTTEAPTTEATEAPTTEATEAPTTEATEAPTNEAPTLNTYTVTIKCSDFFGGEQLWEITNVYGESTFMSDGCELRVLYTTSDSTATMLMDFTPTDFPYIGAYTGGSCPIDFDYDRLAPYGHLNTYSEPLGDDEYITYTLAGSYYSLPSGSWFFGDTVYDTSFFVVVDNYEAYLDGSVPSM